MKNIYLLLLLAVVMLATSCSKDYRNSIPAGCQVLAAVNLMETSKQIGIADDKGKQSELQARPPTLPHCIAVPSAQPGLTSLFGMGRGGTPAQ